MKKIFLIGYYGYNNFGDELLLSEISNYLKTHTDYEISALSFDAKETAKKYNIIAVSRLKNFALIKHIFSVDVLCYGGGSILQDVTSSKSLYYYLGIFLISKLFHKRVYFLANGYGPIIKTYNKKILKICLKFVDGVIARDIDSYNEFNLHKIKNIYNGVDCAFLCENPNYKKINEDVLKKYNIEKDKYILVSLRKWDNLEKVIKYLIEILAKYKNYKIVFISMKIPDDYDFIVKRIKNLENKKVIENFVIVDKNEENIFSLFNYSKVVVAMRLHSLILSSIFKKPFLAISYDPKVESFSRQTSQQMIIESKNNLDDEILKQELTEKLNELFLNFDYYERNLIITTEKLKIRANEEFQLFFKWLNKGD